MKNKIIYVSSLILGIYFLFRLIDQSQMIHTFPLDFTNDWASYMAQLHFLKECGIYNFCPYWYNGFISFQITSPGWFIFTLPLYLLTNDILISSFVSFIILYIIAFLFFYIIGKDQKWSIITIIFSFLLFFANPIAIGNFIRLGRIVSLFGFTIFLGIAALILKYRYKKIDLKFAFFLIPLYTFGLISHPQEAILSSILIFSLFLIKRKKERIIIIFSVLGSLIASSFWLVPFILNTTKTNLLNYKQSDLLNWLLSNNIYLLTNLAAILVPLALFFTFYLYFKENSITRKELIFYSPVLILNFLFLLKLVRFIPILKHISPDPYIMFFLFFTIFIFFNIKFKKEQLKKFLLILVLLIVCVSVIVSAIKTPYFIEHKDLEKEVISLLPLIEGTYFMMSGPEATSYTKAYYSYGAIYHNLSTAHGWYNQVASPEYLDNFEDIYEIYYSNQCDLFRQRMENLNVKEVLFYGYDCKTLNSCGFEEKKSGNNACLYYI